MKRIVFSTFVMLAVGAVIVACSGGGSSSGSSSSGSYQGAGSRWSLSMTGSSFTLNKYANAGATTPEMTASGTFTRYENQFVKMTVSSASGTGAPSPGDVAYGLEIPGYAFFLKPLSGAAEPIVMVQSGACPSSNFNANWIIAKPDSSKLPVDATDDMLGGASITFNGASSSLNITLREPVGGTFLSTSGGNNNGTSTLPFDINSCSNGLLRVADGADHFDMYFTTSGSVLVRFPASSGNQIIFASPRQSAAVTQADLAGTYSGLVFEDKTGTDSLFPVKLVIPSSGDATGTGIATIETDTLDSTGIVLSNITNQDTGANALPDGFFRATLNPSSGGATNGRVNCTYSTVSSTKIIACTGYMDNANKLPFFVLARSR